MQSKNRGIQISVNLGVWDSMTGLSEISVVQFFSERQRSLISERKWSRRTLNCVTGFAKQVVLLSLQKRLAARSASGRLASLFRIAKGSPRLWNLNKPVTMTQRTKYFQLRLTQEEYDYLKVKSASYMSVSHYIRSAIKEYSDVDAKQKLRLINDLGEFYRKFRDELSWAGGNLNQAVKRANELSVAGLLTPAYISEVLMPAIDTIRETLEAMKRELLTVTKKAVK